MSIEQQNKKLNQLRILNYELHELPITTATNQ